GRLGPAEIQAGEPKRARVIGAAAGSPAPVLSVRDLAASYGPSPVLSGIELAVAPESCLAVVGESGSGKTTLARCIVGLHKDWNGKVFFDGVPLAAGARKRPKAVLRRIQYIFQNPYTSLNPRKTVGQIVSQQLEHFTSLSFAERSARVIRALPPAA